MNLQQLSLTFCLVVACAAPSWSTPSQCISFYKSAVNKQDILIDDLVRLQSEIYEMSDIESKMLMVTDFKLKIKQVSNELGFDVRPTIAEKFQKLLAKKKKDVAKKETDSNKEKDKKKIERKPAPELREGIQADEIENLKVLFEEEMGTFHTLDDTYFHDTRMGSEKMTGGGVSWTFDERYVVFRNDQTRVFDTKKKKFIKFDFKSGTFSKSGHLWADVENGQTTITDIDTKKTYGPFNGVPATERYFYEDYLITSVEIPGKGVIKDYEFFYHSLEHGFSVPLGKFFALSQDSNEMIRKVSEDSYDIIDRTTGTVIRSFPGQAQWTHGREEYFTFNLGDKNSSYMYRVFDGEFFPLPNKVNNVDELSRDGEKIFLEDGKSTTIIDLKTNQAYTFPKVDNIHLSQDGKKALLHNGIKTISILIDLETLAAQKFDHGYDRISSNGEWLYNYGNLQKKHKMYHIPTSQEINFEAGFYFSMIGKSELFVNEVEGAKGKTIYIGNGLLNDPRKVKIGDTAGDTSPSGAFIVVYRNKKTVLLGRP